MLQLNKRDLPQILPVNELKKELVRKNEPVFESVAHRGLGVYDTLKEASKQVLMELRRSAEKPAGVKL